nr:helix-turn-helix domain-containing protein [Kibdelosporangium sp. MJ126-NF4]
MRSARMAAGLSLAKMAERAHYSKTLLAYLENGERTILPEHVRAYERVLEVDLERLAAIAIRPTRVDLTSLSHIASILGATRRLEDTVGPALVRPTVRGLRDLSLAAVHEARGGLDRATKSLASEVSQYLGWLELANGNRQAADQNLDRAIALAEQAENPDRLFHGLSFRAYAAQVHKRGSEASDYAEAASRVRGTHPRLRTYGEYDRARVLAETGERGAAQRRLVFADRMAVAASTEQPPSSGYWYTDGFWGLERGHVLGILGYEKQARREAEDGFSALPKAHRGTDWAGDLVNRVQRAVENR